MPPADRVWNRTLAKGARLRPNGTSTCPSTHGGSGDHFYIANRDRTAFVCQCGTRVDLFREPEPSNV